MRRRKKDGSSEGCITSYRQGRLSSIIIENLVLSIVLIIFLFSFCVSCKKRSYYLQETPHLDYRHPIFSEVLNRIVSEDMSVEEKLEALFYFTRDEIPFVSDASLCASEALIKNKALCYTKAMIYTSLCRRLGVPARLAAQEFYIAGDLPEASHHYHGIAKIFFNRKWIYVDVVSNKDSWLGSWARNKSAPFESPQFSLRRDVVVDSAYVSDLKFIDYETNDVPERWLGDMQRFLETGRWD